VLGYVKVAASGGKRRRAGFYSAIRREVPIRTFNDWKGPPPGYREVDMFAHGGTSVAGSFIRTLTMVVVATGCTECLPRGRFCGVETERVMSRLYAAARLYVNFFQPSFKLKEKRREGAKVIKRYHAPSTPYERALRHLKVPAAVKQRLRDRYRTQSVRTLGRNPHRPRGTRQSHRSSCRKCAVPAACRRWHSTAGSAIIDTGGSCLRKNARHDYRRSLDPRSTHRRPKRTSIFHAE
jgi:hypothetical protein